MDPDSGLDPEFNWISINALVLIGCLKCSGMDSQKAEVFYRVVQPEMGNRVLIFDKDIRMSIFFLTNLATILELMQRNLRKRGDHEIDYMYYKRKMDAYEKVFQAVTDDFNDSMFGQYANSISRKDFQLNLQQEGWKYFELENLNELFSLFYQEKLEKKQITEVQLTDINGRDDNLSLKLASAYGQGEAGRENTTQRSKVSSYRPDAK